LRSDIDFTRGASEDQGYHARVLMFFRFGIVSAKTKNDGDEREKSMVKLYNPKNGTTVILKNKIQILFEKNIEENAKKNGWCAPYVRGEADGYASIPDPVSFSWETDDVNAALILSKNEDMDPILFTKTGCDHCDVYNLEIGCTYYWRVGDSETRSFTVADLTPRCLYVEGCANVRDIGGYRTVDGKRVKQGMVYRGAQFDNLKELTVTEEGLRTLREVLGIRLDYDIRGLFEEDFNLTESFLGKDVRYFQFPAESYGEFFQQPENCAIMIRQFTDPENYPLYIHCAGGADRTGSLVAALEGILGMDDEDIFCDYEQTSICSVGEGSSRHSRVFLHYLQQLDAYEGTFSQKVCHYMRAECGITDAEMDKIREILLEN